jgi:hypothetical protein
MEQYLCPRSQRRQTEQTQPQNLQVKIRGLVSMADGHEHLGVDGIDERADTTGRVLSRESISAETWRVL